MKICLITTLFEPWLIGGAERYVTKLAKDLSKNHDVIIITTKGPSQRTNQSSHQNPRVIEVNPINTNTIYEMLNNSSSIGLVKKSLWHFIDTWNFSTYKQIKRILEREKPDLIHTNSIKGLSPSIFSAINNFQIPHIHTMHDFELISRWSALYRRGKPITRFNFLDKLYIWYMRRITSNIDVIISPSRFLMNFHTRLGFFGKSKQYVIPHGIEQKDNVKPENNPSREFLFIGQIVEHKGPQIVLEAFKRLKNLDVKLHFIGTGSYLDALKQMAGDDIQIIFHGYVETKEFEQIIRRCSYLIVPSLWYEIFGLVIIEGMNKGLPVIGSNIGAIPELIKDGYNGFLFNPGNIKCLQQIIEKLINNKDILSTLSKNAIDSSRQFSSDIHTKRILDIYSKTILH